MISYNEFITFVCRKPGYGKCKNLINTFPVMEGTDKYEDKLKTAKEWASSYANKEKVNIIKQVPNLFKQGTVRIFDVDERGNGGRAWKIAVAYKENEYVLDLREDILLEIMENYGILKGGIINTDLMLVFSSGYKVVTANSEKIAEIKELMNKEQSLKKIPLKELKPLHVYKNKTESLVYLGRIYQISLADILNRKTVCKKVIATTYYYRGDKLDTEHSLHTCKSLTVYTEIKDTIYDKLNEEESQKFINGVIANSNKLYEAIKSYYPIKTLEEVFYFSLNKEITKDEAYKVLVLLRDAIKRKAEIDYYFFVTDSNNTLKKKLKEIEKLIEEYKNDLSN